MWKLVPQVNPLLTNFHLQGEQLREIASSQVSTAEQQANRVSAMVSFSSRGAQSEILGTATENALAQMI